MRVQTGTPLALSLAKRYPAVAKQWHKTKNGGLTPRDVYGRSSRIAWWHCRVCKADWQEKIYRRATSFELTGRACPWCSPHPIKIATLADRVPKLAAQWHPTKNRPVEPHQLGYQSKRPVWWKCLNGPDHEWQALPFKRLDPRRRGRFRGCPFCGNRRLSVTNSLAAKVPHLARQWHPTKNKIGPDEVIFTSHQKYWWKCATGSHHQWQARCYTRSVMGSGCPFCASPGRRRDRGSGRSAGTPSLEDIDGARQSRP
jgi:hypothetical protein